MESNSLLRFLGLMKKAGSISVSESNCEDDIRSGRSCLLLFAGDCSGRARSRMEKIAASYKVRTILLPFTKSELAAALGTGSCAMISINDHGFSDSFLTKYKA